jgi:ADP-ribosyl-[dinitrogen reductase] hydrolase
VPEELRQSQVTSADERLAEVLAQLSQGTWAASANGISLDPYETVAAVLSCVAQALSLREGLVGAIQLGGDTVAALVAGLMGCRLTADQVHAALPWYQLVKFSESEGAISETAAALATARAVQSA